MCRKALEFASSKKVLSRKVVESIAKKKTTTNTRSPADGDYKHWATKLRVPLFSLIDAGFLAVRPDKDTGMYSVEKGFNEVMFATYAGPVIENIIGTNAPENTSMAAYAAALRMTRDRRMNHKTFWRKHNQSRSLRFGGTLGVPPPAPEFKELQDPTDESDVEHAEVIRVLIQK